MLTLIFKIISFSFFLNEYENLFFYIAYIKIYIDKITNFFIVFY